MGDEYYLSANEAALAVVATAMKKARLRLDTLCVNSLMGGILFSSGGMIHIMAQGYMGSIFQNDPGVIMFIQGLVYPIGLFYVVIMGVDLFNSNVLFFSTAVVRGAVSILDLCISWFVSWWLNLVGNIFVCYVISTYSGVGTTKSFIRSAVEIAETKNAHGFVQTLLRGVAGNFYVSMAIYLQLMVKPLHVKFFMLLLPIFTFVSLGYSHVVADMYLMVMGLINHADVTVGEVIWRVFIPGTLGNMIGGSAFGIVVTWYLHLVVVERDQRELNLPQYDVRDEQPELNQDSRVVRRPLQISTEDDDDEPLDEEPEYINDKLGGIREEEPSDSSDSYRAEAPQALYEDNLSRMNTRSTGISRLSNMSSYRRLRSPKNVFPVYGMGNAGKREREIAGEFALKVKSRHSGEIDSMLLRAATTTGTVDLGANYLGETLKRVITRSKVQKEERDIEAQRIVSPCPSFSSYHSRHLTGVPIKPLRSVSVDNVNKRMLQAGITPKAARGANEAAGIDSMTTRPRMSSAMGESVSTAHTIDLIDSERQEPKGSTQSQFDVKDFSPQKPA
ncbi:uncharacterized protein KQ657_004346 [Scheffersomyces spartinae]|uniref:Formate/nitrite transporter n=1 Tax=Scheffersomyces spartinae TaxID=45513 RepID=A0A9P8AJA9_9ASCO|nr:uncharacterized protein KQ657_004346 [Scheffersomyces spartinae]KAG7194669.1 hypothetical protein KQ657_004346 [Scheffersomyces spartinae]